MLGTIGGDGDAVDCFVLTETPIASGTVIECEPVGLLEQIEDGKTDHKVLAVLRDAPARFDAAAIAVLRIFIAGVFAHVPEVIDTYSLCEYRATGTQLQCQAVGGGQNAWCRRRKAASNAPRLASLQSDLIP